MEDFFDLKNTEFIDARPKMTQTEFVEKTKKLLSRIMSNYGSAHGYRKITEEEFKVTPCDSCKGEMSFEFCGKKVDCVADNEQGECYERVFDKDEFIALLEDLMFHNTDSPFMDLIECEIVEPLPHP